jgi:hypothetical protein
MRAVRNQYFRDESSGRFHSNIPPVDGLYRIAGSNLPLKVFNGQAIRKYRKVYNHG